MPYAQDNAASVRGVAMRVTRLDGSGAPATGTLSDVFITDGFINFTFTPSYSEGDEVEQKNAAGQVCVYYKLPDTIKSVGLGIELCDPDPVLTEMLVGGDVLTAAYNSGLAPAGTPAGTMAAVGYASAGLGAPASSNGVAIEVWANAVVGGKAASVAPFWHYLVPFATFRLDGDRVVENGALATVFAGTGGGNAAFGVGPNMDTTGVSPQPSDTAWDWAFPTFTDRPYLYARSTDAPVGLRGAFRNLGVPITAIAAGIPATLTPVNATRPANLATLTAAGALGQTTKWTTGQYVELGDGGRAYWDGNSWESGSAPATTITATSAQAGNPGVYLPNGAANPANLAGLSTVAAVPTQAWTTGQFVNVGDGTRASWNGTAWSAGARP